MNESFVSHPVSESLIQAVKKKSDSFESDFRSYPCLRRKWLVTRWNNWTVSQSAPEARLPTNPTLLVIINIRSPP
jgi:hypothetical protein